MLTIKGVQYRGESERERLVLEAVEDDNVGRYAVFAAASGEGGGLTNRVKLVYWFPDKEVSLGDTIVLYTKRGTPKEKRNEDGSMSHFFYWDRTEPAWDEPGLYAVVFESEDWFARMAESI